MASRFASYLWVALPLTSVPLAAMGHHSVVEYDFDVVEELEGRVSSVSWRNPHVRLTLSVVNSDGVEVVWLLTLINDRFWPLADAC